MIEKVLATLLMAGAVLDILGIDPFKRESREVGLRGDALKALQVAICGVIMVLIWLFG